MPAVTVAKTHVDFSWLAQEQLASAAMQAAASLPSLKVRSFQVDGVPLLCDTSSGAVPNLVPLPCRSSVFQVVHSIAHPGV
jgi:hypothetical protein